MGAENSKSKKMKENSMNATQFVDSDVDYDVGDFFNDVRDKAKKFGKSMKQYNAKDVEWYAKDRLEDAKYHSKKYVKKAKKYFKSKKFKNLEEAEEKNEQYANSPARSTSSPVSRNYETLEIRDNVDDSKNCYNRRGRPTSKDKGKGTKYPSSSDSTDDSVRYSYGAGPSRNQPYASPNRSRNTSYYSFDDESLNNYSQSTNNGYDGYGSASYKTYDQYGHNSYTTAPQISEID